MQVSLAQDGSILFSHADSSPVRLRANGRRRRANGLYFSVKSGRHLPHESSLELHDLWRAEVSCDVVSSWPQPFTLQFAMDGVLRRYTPDRKDVLSDGTVRIVEIKDDTADADPLYGRKLEQVAAMLAKRGMAFQLHRRAEIEAGPQFSAIEAIQRHRRTRVDVAHVAVAQRRLAHGPMALDAVQHLFGEGPQAFAVICALVVRRLIRIDLSGGLHPAALVQRVS